MARGDLCPCNMSMLATILNPPGGINVVADGDQHK